LALNPAAPGTGAGTPTPEEALIREVQAGALLSAVSTAFRLWATTQDSTLVRMVEMAVDEVLPR
jgi:hypothetical protein